ncbi:signal peptidase I [Staphylococcus massiliensis]|uniref:signal peptidase I n=1 Tax=Staphylococcus massiliensis TaxID=555791 RepID=UPI001F2F22E1|nr:signal peptidase I [Staphylococcus massiliensis]
MKLSRIIKHLITIVVSLIIVLTIQAFVISGAVIEHSHMEPAFKKGDRVIYNKIDNLFNLINRDDVIMYKHGDEAYTSRVIGLPGESVALKDHHLYINDRKVSNNSYAVAHLNMEEIKDSETNIVPPGSYLVLNDVADAKQDSRSFGFIQKKDIMGNVNVTYFPFNRMKTNF